MATLDHEEEAERLDQDIADLKTQLSTLKRKLKVESSTVLSSNATRTALRSSSSRAVDPSRKKLLDQYAKQQAHNQQGMYRGASSVTAFKVQDPDPNAVDGGHVLGLRFEIMSRGQFGMPYFVMLNRPFPDSAHLRVHRHTVPPAIPLAALAARHLPEPKAGDDDDSTAQDLERFVRCLRREIMRYQNRMGVSADLRRGLGLQDRVQEVLADSAIVSVGIADIEAKQIELKWADERSGRLIMDDDGNVQKLVVFGKQGRDWETTKEVFKKNEHIDDVVKKLQEQAVG